MNIIDTICQADMTPLAEQFARFCAGLDKESDPIVLGTVALLSHRNCSDGDTCLNLTHHANKPLLLGAENQVLLTAPNLDAWKHQLRTATFIGAPHDYQPLILDDDRLYLHRHWQEEQIITDTLKTRFNSLEFDTPKLKQRLDELFGKVSSTDNAYSQKLAAAMALTRRLTIITGGPGTGKTTTVTRILALLLEQQPDLRICLAAPTGKASARLVESITQQIPELMKMIDSHILDNLPREASTIHRLLGWQRQGFRYNGDNHLPCDCLLLDESSMVDQGLMACLLAALPGHCRIILLGDRDQLASVEAGSVLGDLTGHGKNLTLSPKRARELSPLMNELPSDLVDDNTPTIADHIAQLTYSYRFASGGGIGKLAVSVNTGNTDAIIDLLNEPNDELNWIETSAQHPSSSNTIIDWAMKHYKSIFAAATASDALKIFESARILTALREGPWSESSIRERFETRLRNEGFIQNKDNAPYKGLPLIIRRNDRETGLFNGDTGIFWPDEDGRIMAWFPTKDAGTLSSFTAHQLPEWQPAWALTVHRSQGSEYDKVLLVLPPTESPGVTKELIYTGITRAISHCTVAAQKTQFMKSIGKTNIRHSGLSERIGW